MTNFINGSSAIVISALNDISLFENNTQYDIYSSSYAIIQKDITSRVKYFFDYEEPKIDLHNLVGEVSSKWYRDNDGLDLFAKEEISIGALLNYKLMIEFASATRFYFGLKSLSKAHEKILISKKNPLSFKIASKYFQKKIEYFDSPNDYEEHITASPQRGVTREPPVHSFLSFCLRLLQWPIKNNIQNKVLVINDWTFKKIDNSSCLNINNKNPLKSFCLRKGIEYKDNAEKFFPSELNSQIIIENIKRTLNQFEISRSVVDDLTDLFMSVIKEEYLCSRKKLINTYCSFNEMFENYSPSMVILPGYAHTYYQTVYGIAKSKNIPTLLIQDGYPFYVDRYLFPLCINNINQMFDYVSAQGEYVKTLFEKVFNANKINTINIIPPIISNYKDNLNTNLERTVIVLFPYGMIHSPYCKWDKKYKYVLDVVDILKSLNFNNISIKLKTSYDISKDSENILLRDFLDESDNKEVNIISGELSDYIHLCDLVVGYIGTAIIESIYKDVPYFIYEPPSLGMNEEFLENCTFLEQNYIHRSLESLKKAIKKNQFVVLEKNKLFDGIEIDKIDFKRLKIEHDKQTRSDSNSLAIEE